ncbi:MAG: hypothetical protein AMXMBFR33_30690 [Candidatus Xenobia bacterium]|jgi:uncharacterized membrane protein
MSLATQILIWILFFATTVYGHAGFKQAFHSGATTVWQCLFSVWGITATLAWCASALLWIAILSRSTLIAAHTSSALSQVLVAATAMLWFGERVSTAQGIGVVLVVTGVYLVNR